MTTKQKPNLFGRDYIVEPYQRVLEITGIFVYFACSLVCLAKMYFVFGAGVDVTWAAGLIAGCALAGYIAADFISGLVHWMGDTFGETDWPIIGPTFIEPFRMHHDDPKDITLHDFVATNGNASFVLMLYLIPISIFTPNDGGLLSVGILAFSVFFTASIFLTNQFHKWSHEQNLTGLGAFLQRFGLVLTPANHNVHHTSPFKESYCITNGWLNPILNRIRFWRIMENIVSVFTKRKYTGEALLERSNARKHKRSEHIANKG